MIYIWELFWRFYRAKSLVSLKFNKLSKPLNLKFYQKYWGYDPFNYNKLWIFCWEINDWEFCNTYLSDLPKFLMDEYTEYLKCIEYLKSINSNYRVHELKPSIQYSWIDIEKFKPGMITLENNHWASFDTVVELLLNILKYINYLIGWVWDLLSLAHSYDETDEARMKKANDSLKKIANIF